MKTKRLRPLWQFVAEAHAWSYVENLGRFDVEYIGHYFRGFIASVGVCLYRHQRDWSANRAAELLGAAGFGAFLALACAPMPVRGVWLLREAQP